MARFAWLAMLAVLATTAALRTYAADSADEKAISKIEQDWNDAIKNKDKTFYEKYLSEDIAYIDQDGKLISGRVAFIDDAMKAPEAVEVTGSEEKVHIHGSTGVVTGLLVVKYKTGPVSITRYTDVYAKGTDGWKVVATQETKTTEEGEAVSKGPVSSTPGQPAGKRQY